MPLPVSMRRYWRWASWIPPGVAHRAQNVASRGRLAHHHRSHGGRAAERREADAGGGGGVWAEWVIWTIDRPSPISVVRTKALRFRRAFFF